MNDMLRITGMASGIDTEGMIQSLMKVERLKVDRAEQDRQVLLWRQEMYNSLNKDFANFIINGRKLFGLTTVSRTGAFLPSSYKNLNWVKEVVSSDETIAMVSSTGKIFDGTFSVNVNQLAEGASLASGERIDGNIALRGKEAVSFMLNDERIVVNKSGNNDISINDIVNEINSKDIGVRASYDANVGRFFLQTAGVGADVKIKIDADDEAGVEFINALKLTTGEKDGSGEIMHQLLDGTGDSIIVSGQNANIDFNGAYGIEYDSNRITINGITMNITGKGEFTIRSSTNVDGIYEKIEQFVKDYNELVDKTSGLLGEKINRNYRPLTAEQKKAMEKDDIELWEQKAKSGLLQNDIIISRMMLNIRQSLYQKSDEFSGPFKLITEIGISTEQYSRGNAGGKLVIDEQKLKDAIAEDPDAVIEFLFKESSAENDEIGGIVTRIHDNLIKGMEDIIKKSGPGDERDLYRDVKSNILISFVTEYGSISLLDKDALQFSRRIDDLNEMLYRKENEYYARFAAMEKAFSRMNQQSAWLMQQFMG